MVTEKGNRVTFASPLDVSEQAPYTHQYWHRDDPDRESIYHIDDPEYATLALTPLPFHAVGTYTYEGLKGEIESVVEVAEPKPHALIVGPAWSVRTSSASVIIPSGADARVDFSAAITLNQSFTSFPMVSCVTQTAGAVKI